MASWVTKFPVLWKKWSCEQTCFCFKGRAGLYLPVRLCVFASRMCWLTPATFVNSLTPHSPICVYVFTSSSRNDPEWRGVDLPPGCWVEIHYWRPFCSKWFPLASSDNCVFCRCVRLVQPHCFLAGPLLLCSQCWSAFVQGCPTCVPTGQTTTCGGCGVRLITQLHLCGHVRWSSNSFKIKLLSFPVYSR